MSVKRYYINRFIRIAPVYYIVILYYFIMHTFIWRDVPNDFLHLGWLRYFLCLNIIVPSDNSFWFNIGTTWTIFVFILFYLLVPMIRKWCTNLKNSIVLCGFLCALSFINIPYVDSNERFPLQCLYYIMVGVIIYFALREKKDKMFIFVSIILIICRGVALPVIDWFVWILLFSILVISSMEIKIKSPKITKIVNKLDEYTYTVYLIHGFGIKFMTYVSKFYIMNSQWKFIDFMIGLLSTIFFSIIVHEMLEKPIQKKLMKLMRNDT